MTKKIIIGIVVLVISLFTFLTIRYNLIYGDSFDEKLMMAGCMNSVLKTAKFSESKNYCECALEKLTRKYEMQDLKENMNEILKKEIDIITICKDNNISR